MSGGLVKWWQAGRQLVGEVLAVTRSPRAWINRLRTVVYFFVLVWRGFVMNRCPIRAAALSYTTLLALVPLLAVALSLSKNFLAETSATVVPKLMDKVISYVAPQLELVPMPSDMVGPPAPGQAVISAQARQELIAKIQGFIENLHAGTIGAVATIFLIFVGVRLLMTVEQTFNDIWGVTQGRTIWKKIVYYWSAVTLGPLLVIFAAYWTGRAEFLQVMGAFGVVPGLERFVLRVLPFVLLWVGFALLYGLMPNTHVRWQAALAGGIFAGTLWQLNSWLSTLYVSRVVTYSRLYGTLGILPVFLVGLYFSWLFVLLGAQVSYAMQNVRNYLHQRAGERIDQHGRELLACRAVLRVCRQFLRGLPPLSVDELADEIGAPPQWLNQLVGRLEQHRLLMRVSASKPGIVPARPPEVITIHDVLEAVRHAPDAVVLEGSSGPLGCVEKLLAELNACERTAPANQNFRDLAARS